MKKHGFTLIELLVVMAIIGILAAGATTAYVGSLKKAARSEAYTNLDALRLLQEAYFADRADYAPLAAVTIIYRGTCPNTTCAAADNGIEDWLPGFRPGGCCASSPFGLHFLYSITKTANPPCFVATATGVPNSRVAGDVFTIDCNNTKNY